MALVFLNLVVLLNCLCFKADVQMLSLHSQLCYPWVELPSVHFKPRDWLFEPLHKDRHCHHQASQWTWCSLSEGALVQNLRIKEMEMFKL